NRISRQTSEGPDLLSPNLRPRHQELIPTPCGPVSSHSGHNAEPIKPWSELSCLLKLYFCFTIASLMALLSLTIYSIYKQHMDTDVYDEDNFTVSLIQFVGIGECWQQDKSFTARFVCIVTLGVIHVLCTTLLIVRPNMMAFRVGGALESLQEQYFLLNLCFSMVTFDLQAQLCLCILITTSDRAMSAANSIILGIGVAWACLTSVVGALAVLKEKKIFVWVFMVQNLPEVAFFVYVMYRLVNQVSRAADGKENSRHVVTMKTHKSRICASL
ncbi:hypothetical protein GBF38_015444, partial [Nibea albiflora]